MKNWIHSETNNSDIIVASKVSLSRNLKDIKFVKMLKEEVARDMVYDIYDKAIGYEKLQEAELIKSWETHEYDLKGYIDKQFVSKSFVDRRAESALISNKDETLQVAINEEDHLKIQSINAGFNLEDSFEEVDKLDDYLEEKFSYEFSEEYGYLTSSIDKLGTGMKASIILHLPMLSINKKIETILKDAKKSVSVTPIFKDGRVYEVSNCTTLGMKEEEILENIKDQVYKLIREEKRAREVLMTGDILKLEDKIYRSLGILKNARIITIKESLELLSNVRLGVEMSLLNLNKGIINRALIESRDSMIQGKLKEILTKEELDSKRAEVIRNILS